MKRLLSILTCFMLLLTVFAIPVNAKTTGTTNEYAYKSGNTLYFTIPGRGLYKYDIKSNKKMEIASSDARYYPTMGFSDPVVKGKYVYVTWNKEGGTAYSNYRVCRISKSGKIKELAKGIQPIIVGNKIYYRKAEKSVIEGYTFYFDTDKWMRMNLDGSNKETVKSFKVKDRKFGKYKVYSKYLGETGATGNHKNDNMALYLKKGNKIVKLGTWFCS